MSCIEDIRNKQKDENLPILLACTELPLVFTNHEMISNNLFSTISALAYNIEKYCNKNTIEEKFLEVIIKNI